jgi:uncharacterized membrane protein
MLVPAAFLVLVVLGALAVDSAAVFLGQRQLNDFTTTAADDAASAGLSPAAFYQRDRIAIDPARAQAIVAALETHLPRGLHDVTTSVSVAGNHVTVTATATVNGIFASAIPGIDHRTIVRSTSTASAHVVRGE